MAVKKKINTKKDNSNYFSFSFEKKMKVLGLFLMVLSFFILLSILSYSSYDEANFTYQLSDLFKGESANNWLGILGAYASYFFINSTIGYSSIIFPVIIFIWGLYIVKRIEFKFALNLSNFLLVTGIIIASFFGVLRFKLDILKDINELSGRAGGSLGFAMGRLLGGIGSIVTLATLMTITLIIAFDVKLSKIVSFFESLFEQSSTLLEGKKADNLKREDNLEKIKELKPEKTKKQRLIKLRESVASDNSSNQEVISEDEKEEETRIKIIRLNEESAQAKQIEDEEMPYLDKENELRGKDVKKFDEKRQDKKEKDEKKKPELVQENIDVIAESQMPNQWDEEIKYTRPPLTLLDPVPEENFKVAEDELKRNAELLKEKLALFDIKIEDITVTPGPVVTLYEIVPSPGVKISRIVSLENDIALALAAKGIRIIAPIPGKSAIGVEIPNAEAAVVNARSVLTKINEVKAELPLALGKTIAGDIYITDLAKMPHMLIAGSTGSGKSVGINMIITSLLYSKDPSDVKFVIVDPKKIELSFYQRLNKHFLAVSPDLEEEIITNPQNAVLMLKSVEYEMEKRYNKLAKAGVRNIVDYNLKVSDPKRKPKDTEEMQHYKLPYIVVIIDELADLMITASKEVEEPIARLAQLARAVGIHLVLATQRPSVNVITGVIKANFSARMAYQVATKIDSRTILDMNGAEQLLGRGDMLFLPAGTPKPIRIQNAFISTEEVEKITNYIYTQPGYSKRYFLSSLYEKKKEAAGEFLADKDPMFDEAARVIVRHQQGSVSLLQRRLKLGYSRAARIVDQLEEAGIVGPAEGSKVRAVLVEDEQQLETILRAL